MKWLMKLILNRPSGDMILCLSLYFSLFPHPISACFFHSLTFQFFNHYIHKLMYWMKCWNVEMSWHKNEHIVDCNLILQLIFYSICNHKSFRDRFNFHCDRQQNILYLNVYCRKCTKIHRDLWEYGMEWNSVLVAIEMLWTVHIFQ